MNHPCAQLDAARCGLIFTRAAQLRGDPETRAAQLLAQAEDQLAKACLLIESELTGQPLEYLPPPPASEWQPLERSPTLIYPARCYRLAPQPGRGDPLDRARCYRPDR